MNQEAQAGEVKPHMDFGGKTLNLAEMEALLKEYNVTWDEYEAAKEISSNAYEKFAEVESRIMKALGDAQKTSYKGEEGTVTVSVTPTVKVPENLDEKKKLFAYIQKRSKEMFLGLVSINSATLNKWYNETREAAGDPPGFSIPGIMAGADRVKLLYKAAKKGK
jgi:hypothetical protein